MSGEVRTFEVTCSINPAHKHRGEYAPLREGTVPMPDPRIIACRYMLAPDKTCPGTLTVPTPEGL